MWLCPFHEATRQKLPIDDHSCNQFSVYVGIGNKRSEAIVSSKNIPILGWHYSDTSLPLNANIRRIVVAYYIATRRDINIVTYAHVTLHQI